MEGILVALPFLFIIAKSVIYLVAPSAYLYIRNIFNPDKMYRQFDWLHFIPFAVVILMLANASLRNPEAIQRALADSSMNWFINVSHADLYYNLSFLKAALWLFYTFLQSWCIVSFERKKNTIFPHYNYRLINWIKIFNLTLIILFSSLLVQRVVNLSFISLDFVNDTTMSFILLITLVFLIGNPHILYSLEHAKLDLSGQKTATRYAGDSPNNEVALVKPLFNDKKKEEYLLILDDVLIHTKPYLHKGITVKDLSDQTGIPAHHLSSLISSEFNLYFQDFINLQRIEYLKDHLDDMKWKQLTLEGVCWEVGFTSRTTFFRAFIKFTGMSPSEYFNSIKKERLNA